MAAEDAIRQSIGALSGGSAVDVVVTLNETDYTMTVKLIDVEGNTVGTAKTIDFPLESVVVSGQYDPITEKIILTLQNGNTIDFSVADLIAGLASSGEVTAAVSALQTKLTDGTLKVKNATTADSATTAAEATHATSADNATKATSADNANSASIATKATQDGNGNVITTTYATKSELTEATTHTYVELTEADWGV